MTSALAYIEKNLTDEIDLQSAAREANCSPFHFMRMFEVITGTSPAEYARRRRLSSAALELASGRERILDIAVKYGYDSPDSFARAFKRGFECLPSEARIPGTKLTGLTLRLQSQDGSNFVEIPAFWDTIMNDGRCAALAGKTTGSKLGICGVCHSHDMKTGAFVYTIAVETPGDRKGLPAGGEDITVPASSWAKFTSRGPLHPNFQETIKRIYSEGFPASEREHAGTAEIEFYPAQGDPAAPDYWCEYWVPLKR